MGSGTDPTEGSALGAAILRKFAEIAELTVCTTHHGQLKALKTEDVRFENACVEFDEASLAPTYRMLWGARRYRRDAPEMRARCHPPPGIPGRSNALTIASRLGLDPAVISDARSHLEAGDVEVGDVVASLQVPARRFVLGSRRLSLSTSRRFTLGSRRFQAQQAEQRLAAEELDAMRAEAEAARAALAAEAAEAAAAGARDLERRRAELDAELDQAREQIRGLLHDARAAADAGGAEAAEAASRKLGRLAGATRGGGSGGDGSSGGGGGDGGSGSGGAVEVAVGDSVVVERLGDRPLKVEKRQGRRVTVAFGGMNMKVRPQQHQPQQLRPTRRTEGLTCSVLLLADVLDLTFR